jgi:acyl-CoA synthetase (NDP forming)
MSNDQRYGAQLRRFLEPSTVALVGLRESVPRHAVTALHAAGLDTVAIHPRHASILGIEAFPSLSAVGRPIDAVLSLVNARASVEVVREASEFGVGGVAVWAAGYSEVGAEGAELQRQLVQAAGSMPVLGPNCNGFINVLRGAFMSAAPELRLAPGGVGIVSHSGGFLTDLSVCANERQVGFSTMISTGNEAVTDLVDYMEYLIDDPQTRVIGLIVESIRRPEAFFAAVARAYEAGKPVVTLKMGRSQRGQQIAASHTGAVIGESWVYDAAFSQFGVLTARDLADLLDRVSLFDQLEPTRWSAVSAPAVLTVSGGAATLTGDVCEDEGLVLDELDGLKPAVRALLPQAGTINPIDMTGFVMRSPELLSAVFETYADSPDVDVVVGLWTLGLPAREFADGFLLPFVDVAKRSEKPFVLSAIADAPLSKWAEDFRDGGVAVQHGLRPVVRGLAAMRDFARFRPDTSPTGDYAPIAAPGADAVADGGAGLMLTFSETMRLLSRFGIPVAPYRVIGESDPVDPAALGLGDRYVVKIADCAHRTDIGAVHLNVTACDLPAVVADLRVLAGRSALPGAIAIQAQLPPSHEFFIGAQADAVLGPVVVCSASGGIYVESAARVPGRIAPFGIDTATGLARQADTIGLFAGARGSRPLDLTSFAQLLQDVSRLVASAREWLVSLDINPVLAVDGGYCAVDGLAIVRG